MRVCRQGYEQNVFRRKYIVSKPSHQIMTVDNVFIRFSKSSRAKADLWLIHGFPESSLSFREAFESDLAKAFNIFAPDLPGNGTSPVLPNQDVSKVIATIKKIIQRVSKKRKLAIVAHSWGGVVGIPLCKLLSKQVIGYIDVEGSIIDSKFFFKEKALDPSTLSKDFSQFYLERQLSEMNRSEAHRRYYSSVRFADPVNLLPWVRSCLERIANDILGAEYRKLKCPKSYYWGSANTQYVPVAYLKEHQLQNESFDNCGHWPMIDTPKAFYGAVGKFFGEI
jgi:pimeloyl-ACP methyl ester carboxylesterase